MITHDYIETVSVFVCLFVCFLVTDSAMGMDPGSVTIPDERLIARIDRTKNLV